MQGELEVRSEFKYEASIPVKYTADGENVSPPLTIKNIEVGVVTSLIVMDDPDAPVGTFTHWLIWNIPVSRNEIPEGVPAKGRVWGVGDARQGQNDFGNLGYGGPAPSNKAHTYRFKVYTLDKNLDLEPGADKEQLLDEMEDHILQRGLLRGKYGR